MIGLDILVVGFFVGGLLFAWFAFIPGYYMPREPELPCPVCGNPERNCYGQMTSACRPEP